VLTCYFCNKPGHVQADCFTKKRVLAMGKDKRGNDNGRFQPYNKGDKRHGNGKFNKQDRRAGKNVSDDDSSGSDDDDQQAKNKGKQWQKRKQNKHHFGSNVTAEEEASPIDDGSKNELMRWRLKIGGVWVDALVDTGAAISIFNTRLKNIKADKSLFSGRVWLNTAVRGMRVEAQGYANLDVEVPIPQRTLRHKFLLTDTAKEDAIIGIDFIRANEIVVDPAAKRVIFKKATGNEEVSVQQGIGPSTVTSVTTTAISKRGVATIEKSPALTPTAALSDGVSLRNTAPKTPRVVPVANSSATITPPSSSPKEPPVVTSVPSNSKTTAPAPNKPTQAEKVAEGVAAAPSASSAAGNESANVDPTASAGRKQYHLFATSSTVIVPALTQTIDVCCKVPLQPGFYATRDNQSSKSRLTRVAEQIIEVTGSPIIRLSVTIRNDSLFPVSIREGERLVTLDPVCDVIVQTGDSFVNSMTVDGEPIPDLDHLTAKQRNAILSALQQHSRTFYRDGQPLQATNLAQHRIELKEGSDPVFTSQYPLPKLCLRLVPRLPLLSSPLQSNQHLPLSHQQPLQCLSQQTR